MARIDISEIRGLLKVGVATDQKGNPVGVLEVLGQQVLFAPEDVVYHSGSDHWEDVVGTLLAQLSAKFLLDSGAMEGWSAQSPTGREVRRLDPEDS